MYNIRQEGTRSGSPNGSYKAVFPSSILGRPTIDFPQQLTQTPVMLIVKSVLRVRVGIAQFYTSLFFEGYSLVQLQTHALDSIQHIKIHANVMVYLVDNVDRFLVV